MNNNNNLLRKILSICKEVTNHEEFNNELTISVKPQKLLSLFDNLKKNDPLSYSRFLEKFTLAKNKLTNNGVLKNVGQ